MSIDTTFRPITPLTFVGASAVQVVATGSPSPAVVSFRVRNLSSSPQYFTWGTTSSVTAGSAPTSGNPTSNTIGMIGSSVETFEIPGQSWFIASSATGFEISGGQGT